MFVAFYTYIILNFFIGGGGGGGLSFTFSLLFVYLIKVKLHSAVMFCFVSFRFAPPDPLVILYECV